MALLPASPRATLILTRLQFRDWSATSIDLCEWYFQRICFFRHPDGVDSHLGIRFENRDRQMMHIAAKENVSSPEAMLSHDVVWEVVQNGKSGFRSFRELWACEWSTPSHFSYEFVIQDPTFVMFMHQACVDVITDGIQYGPNLRYNATLCRHYPYHCCEHRNAVNCVNAVLLVIAAGLCRNSKLARDYDWDTAQAALDSSLILAGYTPYLAVRALIASEIVFENHIRQDSVMVLDELCGQLPPLTMLRA